MSVMHLCNHSVAGRVQNDYSLPERGEGGGGVQRAVKTLLRVRLQHGDRPTFQLHLKQKSEVVLAGVA